MQSVPIIIHDKTPCIIQEGVRYCAEKDISPREFGIGVLLLLIVAGSLIYAGILSDDHWDNPFYYPVGMIVIASIFLVIFGG